jgi:hypothetical protein
MLGGIKAQYDCMVTTHADVINQDLLRFIRR